MGFINWQNLKKYIRRGTDSEVARIGHVNAVYNALKGGGPLPTQVVTEITANGNGPYSNEVTIDVAQASVISTDYKVSIDDAGSGFTLGIEVPYHEVIGTISFPANIDTDNPTLEIVVCNTTGDGSADWSIAYQAIESSYEYVLSFTGDSSLYNNGVLITTPLQGKGTGGPYYLLPLGNFAGSSISIGFIEDYISEDTIRRQVVDTNDNIAASFNFHLILPINNS